MSETLSMGAGGLGDLAQRVLHEWQVGFAEEAEELETYPDCGDPLAFEDPKEGKMLGQWTWWQPAPVGSRRCRNRVATRGSLGLGQ